MNVEEFISQVEKVLAGQGAQCDFGCSQEAIPEMIDYIKKHLPAYPFCVIADWTWLDINLEPEVQALFGKRGAKPCFIYAHKVIEDQAQRPFKSVRTTYLQDFQKNCIFLSKNTAYILTGQGTRVSVDPQVLRAIFF